MTVHRDGGRLFYSRHPWCASCARRLIAEKKVKELEGKDGTKSNCEGR